MELTKENYTENLPIQEQLMFSFLLDVLKDINSYKEKELYIDWRDFHDEYSPERTDPCPDYYGTYTLRYRHCPEFVIGSRMTIDELEDALNLIYYLYFKERH